MKETIQTAAESFLPALWAMSRAMYDHPELGLEEVNSSRMLREWLAEQGFKVEENFHGLPTAFRAVYGSGRPVLGFLCCPRWATAAATTSLASSRRELRLSCGRRWTPSAAP